jgi:hypothetical protein
MNRAPRSGREPAANIRPAAPDPRLGRVRLLARLLDNQFPIPGTSYRVGIDPLLGLVPGIGDALGTILSTWVLITAARLGAPAAVLARMGVNIAVDSLAGLIPLVGDLFDAGYKANARNVRLLESWVQRPAPTRGASRALVAAIIVVVAVSATAVLFAGWKLFAWAYSYVSS